MKMNFIIGIQMKNKLKILNPLNSMGLNMANSPYLKNRNLMKKWYVGISDILKNHQIIQLVPKWKQLVRKSYKFNI